MILNQTAVSIGQKLIHQHAIRLMGKSADQFTQKKSFVDKNINPFLSQKSEAPKVITNMDAINGLKSELEDEGYPLGMLGVSHYDLYLPDNVNTEAVRKQHKAAMDLIKTTCPWMFDLVCTTVKAFIPVDCPNEYAKAGFSSNFAKGFVFFSYSKEIDDQLILETAIDYVHEGSHQLTFLLNEFDPLLASDENQLVYSGIKQQKRPAILSLHGAIALSYMCLFRLFHLDLAGRFVFQSEENLKKDYLHLKETFDALSQECEFTDIGKKIMDDLSYSISIITKNLGGKNEK